MNCPACTAAQSDPLTAEYCSGCDECDARSLSGSVQFSEVMSLQRMTDRWQALLKVIAGEDKKDRERLHQRVKGWYLRRLRAQMGEPATQAESPVEGGSHGR
jgi:DNA-binding GntR family transcriptional regulator